MRNFFIFAAALLAGGALMADEWEIIPSGTRGNARIVDIEEGIRLELTNENGENNYTTIVNQVGNLDSPGMAMTFKLTGGKDNQKAVFTPSVLIRRSDGSLKTYYGRELPITLSVPRVWNLNISDMMGGDPPGQILQVKMVLRSTGEAAGKTSAVELVEYEVLSQDDVEKPELAPTLKFGLDFEHLPIGGIEGGDVTATGDDSFTISQKRISGQNNYCIAIGRTEFEISPDYVLCFNAAAADDSSRGELSPALTYVDASGQWQSAVASGLKISGQGSKEYRFPLRRAFKLDAPISLRQIKMVLNVADSPAVENVVDVENIRFVRADMLKK